MHVAVPRHGVMIERLGIGRSYSTVLTRVARAHAPMSPRTSSQAHANTHNVDANANAHKMRHRARPARLWP